MCADLLSRQRPTSPLRTSSTLASAHALDLGYLLKLAHSDKRQWYGALHRRDVDVRRWQTRQTRKRACAMAHGASQGDRRCELLPRAKSCFSLSSGDYGLALEK